MTQLQDKNEEIARLLSRQDQPMEKTIEDIRKGVRDIYEKEIRALKD